MKKYVDDWYFYFRSFRRSVRSFSHNTFPKHVPIFSNKEELVPSRNSTKVIKSLVYALCQIKQFHSSVPIISSLSNGNIPMFLNVRLMDKQLTLFFKAVWQGFFWRLCRTCFKSLLWFLLTQTLAGWSEQLFCWAKYYRAFKISK